jgi:hypothetical protein
MKAYAILSEEFAGSHQVGHALGGNSPAFQRWVSIRRVLEVPSGTTGPWKFVGASFVPEGTPTFSSPHFPSVKTLGYFQEADRKLVPVRPAT